MHQGFNITESDIQYAEELLLPPGKTFDAERRAFILNCNTIDLQAVPGSGKTTALLAKLVILERKLPFASGSGILVLSHTNAAIDEIKEKIQKHCPKLFSYPNFIGTMQSFVDQFLAVPYYIQKFKKKPVRIDHEIYNEKIKSYLSKLWLHKFGLNKEINSKVAYIKNSNEALFYNCRLNFSNEIQVVKKLNEDILEIKKPKGNTSTANYRDYSEQDKKEVYNWFLKFKKAILKSGVLHYDDAYFLAEMYLKKMPSIISILQKRFSFVFVDEMQDMEMHQYNLIERIFYENGNGVSIIQRIGDRNQAIYNSSKLIRTSEVWQLRSIPESVLNLSGSKRLSGNIASVVKNFALYHDADFDIVGNNNCDIKPHILLFDNDTIKKIIPFFAKLVLEKNLANSENPIKVICWNTDWKGEDVNKMDSSKLRLEDYHPGFKKEKGKTKHDYDNLKSYLIFYDQRHTLKPIRNNILNAFLKILRIENITRSEDRHYTKSGLINLVRKNDEQKYYELNLNLYNWSIGIINGNIDVVWTSIKAFIPVLLEMFEKTISLSSNFINDDNMGISSQNVENFTQTNCFKEDGLEIEITSVHSVKGQTHCATLYLESFYYNDSGKSYESQRLAGQFLGNQIRTNVGLRIKQSAKMAYVGFSRPTDLLCVAVHKDRFDRNLSEINRSNWEIVIVS